MLTRREFLEVAGVGAAAHLAIESLQPRQFSFARSASVSPRRPHAREDPSPSFELQPRARVAHQFPKQPLAWLLVRVCLVRPTRLDRRRDLRRHRQ